MCIRLHTVCESMHVNACISILISRPHCDTHAIRYKVIHLLVRHIYYNALTYNRTITMNKELKFVSTIGKLGEDRLIINIPKRFHNEAKELMNEDPNEDHMEIVVTVKRLDYSKL